MTPTEFNAIETPRTDSASVKSLFSGPALDHAQQLEREVTFLKRALEDIRVTEYQHRAGQFAHDILRTLADLRTQHE